MIRFICYMLVSLASLTVACGSLDIRGGSGVIPSATTSPAGGESQNGIINALAKLEAKVEAIGVQINSSTYESWSLKASVVGMLSMVWMMLRQKTKQTLANTALDRVIKHLEVYRDQEGVDKVIEHLRVKDDDVEKYLHQRVKSAT